MSEVNAGKTQAHVSNEVMELILDLRKALAWEMLNKTLHDEGSIATSLRREKVGQPLLCKWITGLRLHHFSLVIDGKE